MHDFTVLVLSNAYASSVAMTLDMLTVAASIASPLGVAIPRWRVVSTESNELEVSNGLRMFVKKLPKRYRPDNSILIVPGLGLDNPESVQERLKQADSQRTIEFIRKHANAGGIVAASCSSVFLCQAAGLLSDRKATTSWWLAQQLQELEPRCRVEAERIVIADGNIITAGAAFAQMDLLIHLIRLRFGAPLADGVSRALLIDKRQSQALFAMPVAFASGHDLIARLTKRVRDSLPHIPTVAALAAESCISERTLSRHVKAMTGSSTKTLIQSVQIGVARQLLESSRLNVEQVAERVGYADSTALRRTMFRHLGAIPSQIRLTR